MSGTPVDDRPTRRRLGFLFLLITAIAGIALGIYFCTDIAGRSGLSKLLVGQWNYTMFTGEEVVVEFLSNGTVVYVDDGRNNQVSKTSPMKLWKTDGRTITFVERERGGIGLGKHLLGIRDVGPDVWEVRDATQNRLSLGKPNDRNELVMQRVNGAK